MMDEQQAELLVERLIRRIEQSNIYFLQKIGSAVKQMRELTPSQAQQLVQILKYGGTYEDIIKQISKYMGLNIKDVNKIFKEYAKKDRMFYKQFYKYRNIPFDESVALQTQRKALTKLVKNEMYNFTRSNVLGYTIRDISGKVQFLGLKETYNRVLDEALLNVGQGKETFDDAMKHILRDIGGSGLKTIEYESGRSIRLDSAVRMHLKGRLRELHNENQKIVGEEIQADGIEISVHENPAPDHELVQGRQFSNDEYNKLNDGLDAKSYDGIVYTLDHDHKNGYRPISEMNCYHYIFSIVLGVSRPEYTNKELQQIIDQNDKGFDFDGKHYTMYQGTQLQRMLERRIREQKDIQILAKTSGNEYLAGEAQNRITMLTRKYKQLSDISGLPTKIQRMTVNEYRKSSVANRTYQSTINKFKVGTFDIKEYTNQFDPTTNDIVLMPKRYDHINGYKDRQQAISLIPGIIKNPDHVYVEIGKRNTIWLTKKMDEKKSHKLVIKLNTTTLHQKKELGYKNSVITMHPLKTKTLENYVGKRTIELDNKAKK